MAHTRSLLLVPLAVICLASPCATLAARGGDSTGSAIRVEILPMPSGALQTMAAGINDHGTVIVGSATWKTNPGRYFAARWTRTSASDTWRVEDLRPLLPAGSRTSRARHINNAGTVTVYSELDGSVSQTLVVTSSGATIDLGTYVTVEDLSNADAMVGFRFDQNAQPDYSPLFWPTPTAVAEQLPVSPTTRRATAKWLVGTDIFGTLEDSSGHWLVRWSGGSGNWSVTKLLELQFGYNVSGINSAGRLAFWFCEPGNCGLISNDRAAVWDAPYTAPWTFLPTLGDLRSYSGSVMENGAVIGSSESGTQLVPVIWPTPDTVVALPHPSPSKGGGVGGFNEYRQIVGSVEFNVKGQTRHNAVLWTLP